MGRRGREALKPRLTGGRLSGVVLRGGGHDGPVWVALGLSPELLAQPGRPGKRADYENRHYAYVAPGLQLLERRRAQPSVGAEHGASPLAMFP